MKDIQTYQPSDLHQIPPQMYALIQEQQRLQREANQIKLFELTSMQPVEPAKPIPQFQLPTWVLLVQKYFNTGVWFLVALFALICLHLATFRSLHPETTIYDRTYQAD